MMHDLNALIWICEYAVLDSMGRNKGWQYGGIASTESEISKIKEKIASETSKNIEFRAHRYSHAHGKNA